MSVDSDILELYRRTQALEANPPGGGYERIQDEGVDLPKRRILDFVGGGVTAADDGSSKTIVTVPGAGAYVDYPPVLTSTGSFPVLGASDSLLSRWTQSGTLVHYYGQGTFSGDTFTPGTGGWELSLPVGASNGIYPVVVARPNGPVGEARIGGPTSALLVMQCVLDLGVGDDTHLAFLFPATWPIGTETRFGGTGAGWTFASPGSADVFQWSIVYEATA